MLLGQACGDALGVPYEFGPRLTEGDEPQMRGGGLGPYEPGEWSDDTQMAVCIAEVAATGAYLTSEDALDRIGQNFIAWCNSGATDIGVHTRALLTAALNSPAGSWRIRLTDASRDLHRRTGRTAGNGALMRTSIVGLSALHDRRGTAAAARSIAKLTHYDPRAGDSCVLWSEAIRTAVHQGDTDLRAGLDLIPEERRDQWARWIADAEQSPPWAFSPNGFTVTALQAAWSAIRTTPVPTDAPPATHLQRALANAVRAGHDTDTVAAIAGGLLGAMWGVSAVPWPWRRAVHGWPGLRGRDLVRLTLMATGKRGEWPDVEQESYHEPPTPAVRHPHDDGVWLGTVNSTGHNADAIVSLCRQGTAQVPAPGLAPEDHLEVWLVDDDNPAKNPHLEFVLADTAGAIAGLRAEGKRVLVHCVRAEQRTPSVALAYARLLSVPAEKARRDILDALPNACGSGPIWDAAAQV